MTTLILTIFTIVSNKIFILTEYDFKTMNPAHREHETDRTSFLDYKFTLSK
jgi:hypothetical protein